MSKSIALGLVGAGGILLAILLTGCTDAPSPTPSAGAVPTPTMAPTQAPTATPTPTPTTAPTNTPTPEPTATPPATSTLEPTATPTATPTLEPTATPTPTPTPDLVVGLPTVSDGRPTAGASFTLNATVRNRGDGSSDPAALRFYRSTDSNVTSDDTDVGTVEVVGLDASGSSYESIRLTAPSTPDTYYYGACVNSVSGESDTANNCSDAVAVTVLPLPSDLVVDTPSSSLSTPMTGQSLTLNVTVRNRGDGSSDPTTLRFYRSTDSNVTSDDTDVGTVEVVGLDASGSSYESIRLTAPSTPDTYYYGACVNSVSGESDTANNCSDAVAVTVLPLPSDLVVDTPSSSLSTPMTGQSLTLNVTVRNRGDGSSGPTTLRFYRSTDSNVTSDDTDVGTVEVVGLDASSSYESIRLTAPSTPDTYYYGACVNSVSGESDTANNCSDAVAVTVLPLPSDLVVDTPSSSLSTPMTGQSLTLNVTVRNRGDGSSGPTTLSYFRSTDSTITSGDTEVGTDHVAGLDAPGSSAESILTYAPSTPGTYYYGACVDSVSRESDTTNNCSAVVAATVSEFKIENLPWVTDGITEREERVLDHIRAIAQIDPSMSQRVAGSQRLSDGVTESDWEAVFNLRNFADTHPEIAVLVTTVPDENGSLMKRFLSSLRNILSSNPGRPEQFLSQSWFQDGLTEEEAALIVALGATLNDDVDSEEVFADLLQRGHVRSETISLPLAGEVDLFAVGRSEFESELEGLLERTAFAVESIEGFMGTPWPAPDVIAFLELESDLGSYDGGWYAGAYVVLKDPSKYTTYHELAHHYFTSWIGPEWLTEGGAEFLNFYTLNLTEGGTIDADYIGDQGLIAAACAPDGSANVHGWNETGAGSNLCPYWLGRQFLRGMYRALGHEVVSSALRELYETSLTKGRGGAEEEDEIYQAFLTNTPSSQRDEFRFWYHCLHGRPIPGYTHAPKPAHAPEIRDALIALYNATNGPGWNNNENWLSEAPLDQWSGVFTDCDGSLTHLVLIGNQLAGPIPPELGNLANLQELELLGNELTGPIPAELGNLSNLRWLGLQDNQLPGPIPPELGNLANLHGLGLGGNQLTGPIPSWLGNLANLQGLDLGRNQLTGPIPPELANLANLTELDLATNQLTGPIPPELGDLSKLTILDLSTNQLTGPIPSWLVDRTDMFIIGLADNMLTGPIPPELGNLSRLAHLFLDSNQLAGPIPPELGNLANLFMLELGDNQLTGPIPPELGNLANLFTLKLGGNQLTGPIPSWLGNFSNLQELELGDNQLTGPIPSELGNLANLWTLELGGNQLTGPIPSELGNLANLQTLELGGNQLTGCVPARLKAAENTDIDQLGLEVCKDP